MKDDERKPDPDELLRSIVREEGKKKRGHLRVFLGMCPGVGKTYAMLRAAQEKKRGGVNVLVGIVETHKRQDTQSLLEGLECLTRKAMNYRDKAFEELDVDAILEAKPELVLVDELAHSNVPGSRHPKRYHDVKEILEAGIDVYSTMNVQHLESRIDLIRQITGVPVKETVPDSFFEIADQVELIDLPPPELIKRLKEGKVYLGEMAEKAIEGFFQEEHLSALRELALRFTAEVVGGELQDQMLRKHISGPWQTREKLLVAISHSPYSKRLIRAARRRAASLEADWIALYIDNGEPLNEEDKAMLRKNMDMARELGAQLISVRDTDIPSAIRRLAEEKNVTQVIMGRPDRRFFRDLLSGGTILDRLVRETSEIDVHVLRQVRKPRLKKFSFHLRFPAPPDELSQYFNTFWLFVALAVASGVIEPVLRYQAIGFVFLLAVVAVATLADRGPAIFAAVLSAVIWNYFFIPPKFTFFIAEIADVMMCVAYFSVAIAASLLTTKINRQSQELKTRAHQTSLLYDFSRELSKASDIESIVSVTHRFIGRFLGGRANILVREDDGTIRDAVGSSDALKPLDAKDYAVANWVNSNGKRAGLGTETLSGSGVFCLPIRGMGGVIGVLMFFPKESQTLSVEEETTLESIGASIAISIEREKLKFKAEGLRIVEESERLYQTILDSVSHELRTPITAIMGAASAMQDPKTGKTVENLDSLTEEILKGTHRLNHVVENLLDMSRMSAGQLILQRDLVELTETVETLVGEWKLFDQVESPVKLDLQEGVYAKVDTKLLRNALGNLLRNALMHSPKGGEITVKVCKNERTRTAIVEVSDTGKGIAEADIEKIFERFYRVAGTPSGGMGLGLSIVKGIVEAHDGRVTVAKREDCPGSVFRMTIPLWRENIPTT